MRPLQRLTYWLALVVAGLALPLASQAANPILTIQGTGGTGSDVTAFVDQVEIVRVSDGTVVSGAVANLSFESNSGLSNTDFGYNPTGASWTFNQASGIARVGSAFSPPTTAFGNFVAFVQSTTSLGNGQFQQALTLADGTYQVRFRVAQRTCCTTQNQRLNVLVNGTQVGTILTTNTTGYDVFTSNTFVVAPNNALAFDGTNDQVSIPNSAVYNAALAITLESWVRTSATGEKYITTKADDSWYLAMDGGAAGGVGTGVASFYLNGPSTSSGGWLYGTTNLADGRWHHVAGTYDGTTLRLYVDGVQQSSRAASGAISTGNNQVDIGTRTGDFFWNGSLDELRIYNTALTVAQVRADMFSTTAAVPASQVAYFNFDQGTAGGSNAGITTLTDQSTTANNGTLLNFALTGTASNWVRSFPTVTGISPTSGQISSSVTVVGTNLLDATSFKFNGTAVNPFTAPISDFSATVTVPSGTTTGPVSVSSAALTAYNGPTFTVLATPAVTWTGATSTNWATAGNWSPAVVPTSSIDVTIPSGPANQPVVSGTQAARNVTVQAGANLTLAAAISPISQFTLLSLLLDNGSTLTQGAGSELYPMGDMTNNGATFALAPTSKVGFILLGHSLKGTAGVTFQTVTVGEQGNNDFLNIQVPMQVRRKLGLYNNSKTSLLGLGSLTLLSDATGTALVENGIGSTVTGTVTVQQFISSTNAGLGYRHYSAPVSNTTVADLATAGFAPEVSQAATYNASATPNTVTPFPTVFAYDQSRVTLTNSFTPFDRGFAVPASTSTALTVGQGYAVNIAGTQLVDFVGTLNNGSITRTLARNAAGSANAADAGWNLVGNPYPAPLDYTLVTSANTNLENAMYVFESATQYTGSYRPFVNGLPTTNRYVASGQGFFVRVSSGQTSGSLNFLNSQRVTDPATLVPFRRDAVDARPLVQLDLRGTTGAADAFYTYAEAGATPAFDAAFDARKLPNTTGLNLASLASTGEALAIDGRPAFTAASTLALTVGVPAAGTYTLAAATLANLPAGLEAFLTDATTGQTVNLSQQPRYAFSVSPTQAASLLTSRFTLHFAARSVLATAPALTAAEVTLYPNPAHSAFTVLVPGVAGASLVQATLLNALGQVVNRQSTSLPTAGARLTVDAAGLAPGVYTLRLQVGATALAKRVVIQ
ncbi:LamG-like jellyroll fold domain-containing protein [Hymenobacter siberiensis]|nr:LamG-like jellyroll fold domain-containing protein [Hymenobacter siberiensis]